MATVLDYLGQHTPGATNKLLLMEELRHNHLAHRAIGVVYEPKQESGNYVPTVLPDHYAAFLYIDQSKALHSLHRKPAGSATGDLSVGSIGKAIARRDMKNW